MRYIAAISVVFALALYVTPTFAYDMTWTIGQGTEYQIITVPSDGYVEVYFPSCTAWVCGPDYTGPRPAQTGYRSWCSADLDMCCQAGNTCSVSYIDYWGKRHDKSGTCNVGSC